MNIISFTMIMELNQLLHSEGFSIQLKLTDACGSQTVSLTDETSKLCVPAKRPVDDAVYKMIETYFNRHFMKIKFNMAKNQFYLSD